MHLRGVVLGYAAAVVFRGLTKPIRAPPAEVAI
jgi:hypothetical protein